jgi:hypothetical protein
VHTVLDWIAQQAEDPEELPSVQPLKQALLDAAREEQSF